MNLQGKVIINSKIKTETGLHIGGSRTSMNIGDVDLNVIKTSDGIPYIPGSSLKGKLRSLLAKTDGKKSDKSDEEYLKLLFNGPNDNDKNYPVRLIIRDAFLCLQKDNDQDLTEIKVENTIKRETGAAINPRPVERVPYNMVFDVSMILDVWNDSKIHDPNNFSISSINLESSKKVVDENGGVNLAKSQIYLLLYAMKLLEDDYLGGSGSRGYGKVKFKDINIFYKPLSFYETEKDEEIRNLTIHFESAFNKEWRK